MRRRRVLRALTAAPALSLVGCLRSERGRARIGAVDLANLDTEEYEGTVRIERRDETLLNETYVFHSHDEDDEFDPWGRALDQSWEEEDTYTISARLHGETKSITISEEGCHDPTVYTRDGDVRVGTLHDETECVTTDD